MDNIDCLTIDFTNNQVEIKNTNSESETHNIGTPKAFEAITKAMLRTGWDNKYVYSFSWLGRPIIQLPDDMIRIQELIYTVKPEVIVETGVAHGGSLVYYASILNAIGNGRVVGVDIEIRPHNRKAIEEHRLFNTIDLIEGNSIANETIDKVKQNLGDEENVLIFLDAKHTKDHVLAELEAYSKLIPVGSYIVAMDGIMKDLTDAPRSDKDWNWNNPTEAAKEFVKKNDNFIIDEPEFPFNEGNISRHQMTYWPQAFIKRIG